ncbi:hypothetical protein GCK72_002431 [Caenorhabditis remanei]|uniref:Uncharacterized protein n=1 Tax=Caenorhabditis remanei TaxID=31234 RepID=A0A6A5HXC4_CAERE|nr:hypothetical protein GCK72_002431 [Caenorhabditis remanei]KAF1770612.1 hypothetical protein GCK72_002431 [Caenorhabditis remanei]
MERTAQSFNRDHAVERLIRSFSNCALLCVRFVVCISNTSFVSFICSTLVLSSSFSFVISDLRDATSEGGRDDTGTARAILLVLAVGAAIVLLATVEERNVVERADDVLPALEVVAVGLAAVETCGWLPIGALSVGHPVCPSVEWRPVVRVLGSGSVGRGSAEALIVVRRAVRIGIDDRLRQYKLNKCVSLIKLKVLKKLFRTYLYFSAMQSLSDVLRFAALRTWRKN